MSMPWSKFEGPAKVLMILVTILLVSLGLCGLQWGIFSGIADTRSGGFFVGIFLVLGYAELLAIAVSLVGTVVVLAFWGLRTLYRRLSGHGLAATAGKGEEIQTLFPRDDDDRS